MPDVEVKEISTDQKPIMILGRDLRTITCLRDSLIFGICSGVAGGLLCFMGTSRPAYSANWAFGTGWVAVFVYWFPCRYKYETSQLKGEAFQRKLKANAKEIFKIRDENEFQAKKKAEESS